MDNISILAIGCIDFIQCIKQYIKGVSFRPVLLTTHHYYNDSYLAFYKPISNNMSTYDYLVNNFQHHDNMSIIVKREKSPLRALHLSLFENNLRIKYYAINGWKQNERSCRHKHRSFDMPDNCGYHVYEYLEFQHVTFHKNKPVVKNISTLDLLSPEININVLRTVSDILLKSWHPKAQKIISLKLLNKSGYLNTLGIDPAGYLVSYHIKTKTVTQQWNLT